jgi:hypothetical protein
MRKKKFKMVGENGTAFDLVSECNLATSFEAKKMSIILQNVDFVASRDGDWETRN